MDKIRELDEVYLSYEPSERCWLDGDYVWKVLKGYPGTLEEPLFVTLKEEESNAKGPICKECLEKSGATNSRYPLLIRVKIAIYPPGDFLEGPMRHSNLLILDFKKGVAFRFEPVDDHGFTAQVSELLEKYVAKVAPSLKFQLLDIHPQPEEDKDCPDQGMCVAYVVKAGLDIAMGRNVEKVSLEDIKRFSTAVENLF